MKTVSGSGCCCTPSGEYVKEVPAPGLYLTSSLLRNVLPGMYIPPAGTKNGLVVLPAATIET